MGTLEDLPIPTFVRGYVPRPEPGPRPPLHSSETKGLPRQPLAGEWHGTRVIPGDVGAAAEFPFYLHLRDSDGAHTAIVEARIPLTGWFGEPFSAPYVRRFDGILRNGRLEMRSFKQQLSLLDLSPSIPVGAWYLSVTVEGDRLLGELGNGEIGWMRLAATRR